MKHSYLIGLILGLVSVVFGCGSHRHPARVAQAAPAKGFAVVELFTSEGCSTCPPADDLIRELVAENTPNVYVLAFHVDYWNRLGWIDSFSQAAYSQRQTDYAKAFRLSSAYTPEVIVNGTTEFVGSDQNSLSSAVTTALSSGDDSGAEMEARDSAGQFSVNYQLNSYKWSTLVLTVIQDSASRFIAKGENQGHFLHHVHIVRDLQTVAIRRSGHFNWKIPVQFQGQGFHPLAFIQEGTNGKVVAVAQ